MIDLAWTLKTAVTQEPVSFGDAVLHCNEDEDAEQAGLLSGLISAARGWIEDYTGRSLAPQTWQLAAPYFVDRLWLPRAAPLQSVTFVKYYDTANVLQTLSASGYVVPAFHEPGAIEKAFAQVWPALYDRSDAVQVEYVTGYAAGACPQPLRQALLLLVAHWYANRENVVVGQTSEEIQFAAEALCAPYRVFWRPPAAAA